MTLRTQDYYCVDMGWVKLLLKYVHSLTSLLSGHVGRKGKGIYVPRAWLIDVLPPLM